MRIVIDMQGAQSSGSWNRGIGRYTMSIALALVRNRGEHEIFLALNGAFPESVERIRSSFKDVLPQDRMQVWSAFDAMTFNKTTNDWRRKTGELVREAFLASLNPDIILVSSLFEGLCDDVVTSVKRFSEDSLTAVILYDLIPLIHHSPYLDNPVVESWYMEKVDHLRKADLWLGISDSSCNEGIGYLQLPKSRCLNISTDADSHFKKIVISAEIEQSLRKKYQLLRPFVMYTGGIDHRKNIEGLIRAYAKLPMHLREDYQLAIVCSVQESDRHRLITLADDSGLTESNLILTGFVPEEDLVALYNLCALFVFPSWHEGFGLPALEAMRCGAPVIAAEATSLIELVGLKEALFDPHSDEAIADLIEYALTNNEFRAHLITHSDKQSKKFSWDETALRALKAMASLVEEKKNLQMIKVASQRKPLLAYISPLPPLRSGISDYSAELLPALSEHYEIEVIVAQDRVEDEWIQTHCQIRTVQWFIDNKDRFDRVLYHFGNSEFHQHMFELLRLIPGVVVLHDFYLSGVSHFMEVTGYEPKRNYFQNGLFGSHGYVGLLDQCQSKKIDNVIWKYPCSRGVIENSLGTIFHSENSIRLAKHWYGLERNDAAVIPLIRAQPTKLDSSVTRKSFDFSDDNFVVCSFGLLGPMKLNHRLLRIWLDSDLAKSNQCHLVFVGENDAGEYGHALTTLIQQHPNGGTVRITGWVDKDLYQAYLSIADVAVQLRTLSRGETSAAILDCMNNGIATIVNANGSMADLDNSAVWMLPDDFNNLELSDALVSLWRDRGRRHQMGARAKNIIVDLHNPASCATQYRNAIEVFYAKSHMPLADLLDAVATVSNFKSEDDLKEIARSIARTFPPPKAAKTLFVDISELVQRDAKTGIQRVVRNILHCWLLDPPAGWHIEPIYATVTDSYRYARKFITTFLGITNGHFHDDLIDFAPGDIFFGLDFCPEVQIAKKGFYQELRQYGVSVQFMVYDMLCISQHMYFVAGARDFFSRWLSVVVGGDGVICISNTVAREFSDWKNTQDSLRLTSCHVSVNHLGVEPPYKFNTIENLSELPAEVQIFHQGTNFLMVGTLEPRKGHLQILDAFECIWKDGVDVNLIIVGKEGWMVEDLVMRLRSHRELGQKLFWLEGIDDQSLEQLYIKSTCLIAASYDEGFGLPLIEAAQHGLPIIARDIPVFREVTGEHAFLFDALSPIDTAHVIYAWLKLYRSNEHPSSAGISYFTWKESSQQLLKSLAILQ